MGKFSAANDNEYTTLIPCIHIVDTWAPKLLYRNPFLRHKHLLDKYVDPLGWEPALKNPSKKTPTRHLDRKQSSELMVEDVQNAGSL